MPQMMFMLYIFIQRKLQKGMTFVREAIQYFIDAAAVTKKIARATKKNFCESSANNFLRNLCRHVDSYLCSHFLFITILFSLQYENQTFDKMRRFYGNLLEQVLLQCISR